MTYFLVVEGTVESPTLLSGEGTLRSGAVTVPGGILRSPDAVDLGGRVGDSVRRGVLTVPGGTFWSADTLDLSGLVGDVQVRVLIDLSDKDRVLVCHPEDGRLLQAHRLTDLDWQPCSLVVRASDQPQSDMAEDVRRRA
ncbi:hypothetical protein [Lichenifustis flavocetrariae]|uniref:Uncharacterized protein n=1 Tax=Lichenifustis flavocetrariae TaxID=2949735 RepID=A0AA41Z3W7_9HYPH|nr:hypothetical protein [Lichenifustis flavocetrariae]MCW6509865.1 hypothetical protein [Lichenifustis flavocetrariae]